MSKQEEEARIAKCELDFAQVNVGWNVEISCSGRNAFARSRIAARAVPRDSPNLLSKYLSTPFGPMGKDQSIRSETS